METLKQQIMKDWKDKILQNDNTKLNYPFIKMDIKQLKRKYNLTDGKISAMFGYKNKLSYANSSAKKRIEQGLIAFHDAITRDQNKNKSAKAKFLIICAVGSSTLTNEKRD